MKVVITTPKGHSQDANTPICQYALLLKTNTQRPKTSSFLLPSTLALKGIRPHFNYELRIYSLNGELMDSLRTHKLTTSLRHCEIKGYLLKVKS